MKKILLFIAIFSAVSFAQFGSDNSAAKVKKIVSDSLYNVNHAITQITDITSYSQIYGSISVINTGDEYISDPRTGSYFTGWGNDYYVDSITYPVTHILLPKLVRDGSGSYANQARWASIKVIIRDTSGASSILTSGVFNIPDSKKSLNQLDSVWITLDKPLTKNMLSKKTFFVAYLAYQADNTTLAQIGSPYTATSRPYAGKSWYMYLNDAAHLTRAWLTNVTGAQLWIELVNLSDYKSIPNYALKQNTAANLNTSNFSNTYKNFTGTYSDSANPYRVLLPDTIFISSNHEANIYFDNIALGVPNNAYYNVTCDSGSQYQDYWRWTPYQTTATIKPFTLTLSNWQNNIISTSTSVIKVSASANLATTKRLLIIGDSRTDGEIWDDSIKAWAGSNLTLIGTRDNGVEGYPGKTFVWFESDTASPFVHTVGGHVDLQTYLTNNSFATPDYAILALGTNDVFGATDATIDGTIATALSACDSLIANFLTVNSNMIIGIVMETPPSYSQDAFGVNYGNGQTTWQYKRNIHRFNEVVKSKYGIGGTKYNSHVSLIPAYLFLDTKNNMPTATTTLNARNSGTYSRQINGVHEATAGYMQKADAVWGWLINH